MLDEQMPLLKSFTITAAFGRWRAPLTSSPGDTWVESHRGILWFSAWVTRSRPILRFAVWDEHNTISGNKLDDEVSTMLGDRPEPATAVVITSTKPGDLQVSPDPHDLEVRNQELIDARGEPPGNDDGTTNWTGFDRKPSLPLGVEIIKLATRLLLNSWKIRRTGFHSLGTK
jgi:hypothetical protein